MKITNFHKDDEGILRFFVDSKVYERVVKCLRAKGMSPGGSEHADDDNSEVRIDATIEAVNEALRDLKAL